MSRIFGAVLTAALLAGACTGSTSLPECEALVGPEPWLMLHTTEYGADCVAVGVHQDLRIFNKGTEPLTLEWQGAVIGLSSDDFYETGPIGQVVEPGAYSIEASPYQAPNIVVVDPDDSFSATTELDLSGLGPIELGMTLQEASEMSGQTLVVYPDLAPGPNCWQAVIEGDPYSPVFTVAGDGTQESTIEFITTFSPSDHARTIGDPNAQVPAMCG